MSLNVFASYGGVGGYQILTERLLSAFRRAPASSPVHDPNIFSIDGSTSRHTPTRRDQGLTNSGTKPVQEISLGILPIGRALSFHGATHVLYPAHEGTLLTRAEVRNLNEMDQVWVSSRHSYKVFQDMGVSKDRLRLFPCFIDADHFRPLVSSRLTHGMHLPTYRMLTGKGPSPECPLRFLVVGKYEKRKATREAVEAFLRVAEEHPLREALSLTLKLSTSVHSRSTRLIKEDLLDLLRDYPKAASRIHLLDQTETDLLALYNSVDCLLMPSRAEGNGLPLLESMACALPTVVTGYTSLGMYVTEETNVVLPDRGTIKALDPFFHITPHNFGSWGEVLVEDIEGALKRIIEMDNHERYQLGQQARKRIQLFSYQSATDRATAFIQELQ